MRPQSSMELSAVCASPSTNSATFCELVADSPQGLSKQIQNHPNIHGLQFSLRSESTNMGALHHLKQSTISQSVNIRTSSQLCGEPIEGTHISVTNNSRAEVLNICQSPLRRSCDIKSRKAAFIPSTQLEQLLSSVTATCSTVLCTSNVASVSQSTMHTYAINSKQTTKTTFLAAPHTFQVFNHQISVPASSMSTIPIMAATNGLQASPARLRASGISGGIPVILSNSSTGSPVARFALVTRAIPSAAVANYIHVQPPQHTQQIPSGYLISTNPRIANGLVTNSPSSNAVPVMLSTLPPGAYLTSVTSASASRPVQPPSFVSFTGRPVISATPATVLSLYPSDNSAPTNPLLTVTSSKVINNSAPLATETPISYTGSTPSSPNKSETHTLDSPLKINGKRKRPPSPNGKLSESSESPVSYMIATTPQSNSIKQKRVRKCPKTSVTASQTLTESSRKRIETFVQDFQSTFSLPPVLPPSKLIAGFSEEPDNSPQNDDEEMIRLMAMPMRRYQQLSFDSSQKLEHVSTKVELNGVAKVNCDALDNEHSDIVSDENVLEMRSCLENFLLISSSVECEESFNFESLCQSNKKLALISSEEEMSTKPECSISLCKYCDRHICPSEAPVQAQPPLETPNGVEIYFLSRNFSQTHVRSENTRSNNEQTSTGPTNSSEPLIFCNDSCHQNFLCRLEAAQKRQLLHEVFSSGSSKKASSSDLSTLLRDSVMECYFYHSKSSLLLLHQGYLPTKLLSIDDSNWNSFWKRKLNGLFPTPSATSTVTIPNKKKRNMVSTLLWSSHRWKRFRSSSKGVLSSNLEQLSTRTPYHVSSRFKFKTALSPALKSTQYPDDRICSLCLLCGDQEEDGPGRLLCYDMDHWLHVNCALWCLNVYETQGGALAMVPTHITQARKKKCVVCGQCGAGLPCYSSYCNSYYHVKCAKNANCVFTLERGMYCAKHNCNDEFEETSLLQDISALRRVYIDRPEKDQIACAVTQQDKKVGFIRLGTLVLLSPGQLLSCQLSSNRFHSRELLFPVGYRVHRYYWSMFSPKERAIYECSILERDNGPLFRVSIVCDSAFSSEQSNPVSHKLVFEGETCSAAWHDILKGISEARTNQGLVRLFPSLMSGERLFGLTEPHVVRILESLPGVDLLRDYVFKFSRVDLISEMPIPLNPSGCARSEPKRGKYISRPSRNVQRSSTVLSQSMNGMANSESTIFGSSTCLSDELMSLPNKSTSQFSSSPKHTLTSRHRQYRRLQREFRTNVNVKRSFIQGLGLYAVRCLEKHAMIIEYLGEIIRNEVANMRERRYERMQRGVYMFRINDDYIVDATVCGGLARYVNHSCSPNCTADIVVIDNEYHIILFANRDILAGEELTYDYKFEIEASSAAIPCLCGASNCRKWLNG